MSSPTSGGVCGPWFIQALMVRKKTAKTNIDAAGVVLGQVNIIADDLSLQSKLLTTLFFYQMSHFVSVLVCVIRLVTLQTESSMRTL